MSTRCRRSAAPDGPDRVVPRQGLALEVAGDVDQRRGGDHRWDRRHIELDEAVVAHHLARLEPVVRVRRIALVNVAQPVDLRRDVVGDRVQAARPRRVRGIGAGIDDLRPVALQEQPLRGAVGRDLPVGVSGELERAPVILEPEVVDPPARARSALRASAGLSSLSAPSSSSRPHTQPQPLPFCHFFGRTPRPLASARLGPSSSERPPPR